MAAIEAIYGIFVNNDSVLFLQRSQNRTFSPNKWDLMGGDVPSGKTPEAVLKDDSRQKINVDVDKIIVQASLHTIFDNIVILRHCFVATGNYGQISLDPKKYQGFAWIPLAKSAKWSSNYPTAEALRAVRLIS